jgi:hypothetical protein
METFTALTPSELPILHPSLPRDPTDRNMAASTGDIDPYVKKKSSERLLDLLEITRQAWLPRIVGSQRPADRATLYLRFDQDDELVQEIEKISNKVRSESLLNLSLPYTFLLEITSLLAWRFFSRRFYGWGGV